MRQEKWTGRSDVKLPVGLKLKAITFNGDFWGYKLKTSASATAQVLNGKLVSMGNEEGATYKYLS